MEKMRDTKGEVMLEGMIVVIVTVFLLLWIISIGFTYYQRFLLTAITNDAASRIAASYNKPTSDIIMGYVSTEELQDRDLYRGFNSGPLQGVNEMKAKNYISYRLEKSNFTGVIRDVNVRLNHIRDSALRSHVEIVCSCNFKTPLGGIFEAAGGDGTVTFETKSRAESTDVLEYITTVDFMAGQMNLAPLDSKVVKLLNSIIKVCNHRYAVS